MNQEELTVLGINGSPRDGNSLYLLREALHSAQEVQPGKIQVEEYSFRAKKFSPCVGCFQCIEEKSMGECVIKDDFQSLRDLWLTADVILYSVPVYHVGIPGQLKCFIDRLGNTINRYYRLASPRFLKVVGALAQGTHFAAGQELAVTFLLHHAVLKNCLPVSGDGWESYLGACGWTRTDRTREGIKKLYEGGDPDAEIAVKGSRTLGRRAVELGLILRAGRGQMEGFLSKDPSYRPFLSKELARSGDKA
ncbi:MAG TPA: flavodoxin family protein [Thermodesulfobacteriota bacterium]|nr:flavodoxin family protein [Thermodesulfobacteriota bacterium]